MHRMGHGSMRAALIYQHATADRDRRIADALSDLVDAGRKADQGDTGNDDQGDKDDDAGAAGELVPVAQ